MDAERDSTESTAAIAVFDSEIEMLGVQREVGMGSIEAEQNDKEVNENLVCVLRGAGRNRKLSGSLDSMDLRL